MVGSTCPLLPGGLVESGPIFVHCVGLLPLLTGEFVHEGLRSLPLLASRKDNSFPGAAEILSDVNARGLAIPLEGRNCGLIRRDCVLHGDAARLHLVSQPCHQPVEVAS